MSGLSPRKDPRPGQAAAIKAAMQPARTQLIAQLPTGYGKTFTAASIYSNLASQGRVNRLLYLVPSTGQLDQFVRDGAGDMLDAALEGPCHICDVAFAGAAQAVKQHRSGTHQIFACTIQSLSAPRVGSIVRELMSTGLWMVCVDECHHYGLDRTWGREVLALPRQFLLAMSATPFRPDDDSAFGKPDVVVTYRQAVGEGAVKPLTCHSYEYRIDALDKQGEVTSYTITEITDKAGSDAPDKIDKILRGMRLSPKYISPMVEAPIENMMLRRTETDHKLQVLIGAMSCLHAEMVCAQVKAHIESLYSGQLTVDWVGTGDHGRSDAENREILKRFCPDKVDGRRRPEDVKLDVLVHVGMAGEGLDTIYVSDVVHLNRASLNNSNRQENGRAARWLEGVTGVIHVDSSSDFHAFVGPNIEHSFDHNSVEEIEDEPSDGSPADCATEIGTLPEEPLIRIYDVKCVRIIKGEVELMAKAMLDVGGWSESLLDDDSFMQSAEQAYIKMKRRELEQFNDRSIVVQWKEKVGAAAGLVTSRAIKAIYGSKGRLPASVAGELKKRINTRKKRELGSVDQDVELLRKHYQWLQRLEQRLIQGEVPEWLL
jgi:superfamily II DNA or RNA helicase